VHKSERGKGVMQATHRQDLPPTIMASTSNAMRSFRVAGMLMECTGALTAELGVCTRNTVLGSKSEGTTTDSVMPLQSLK
jgi:hypothetical protein